jgi:hypothetical protein
LSNSLSEADPSAVLQRWLAPSVEESWLSCAFFEVPLQSDEFEI